MKNCSETRAALSDYIDSDLEVAAMDAVASHLRGCAPCRAEHENLLRLVASARGDLSMEPPHDLWVGIRGRIAADEGRALGPGPRSDRSVIRFLSGLAAGLVLAFGWMAWSERTVPDSPEDSLTASYILLLHESPEFMANATPSEVEDAVAEYTAWAGGLAERNQLESAAKLVDLAGWELAMDAGGATTRARSGAGGIGGFFVIRAENDEQALEIARGCPHLERGGEIELRPIEH